MKASTTFVGIFLACVSVWVFPLFANAVAKEKKTAPKTAEVQVKEEPKIEGVTIPRERGGYLGLKIENGTFNLKFYDDKKGAVVADVTRATARWDPLRKAGNERTVLNPSPDGMALIGGKPVRPPYIFKVFLTLLQGEGDDARAVESHVVDFKQ